LSAVKFFKVSGAQGLITNSKKKDKSILGRDSL